MKYCPNCGQPALDSHRFCMRCGADISGAPVVDAQAQYAQPQAAPSPYAAQAPQQQYYAPAPAKGGNTALIVILVAVGAVVLVPIVLIVLTIGASYFPARRATAGRALTQATRTVR